MTRQYVNTETLVEDRKGQLGKVYRASPLSFGKGFVKGFGSVSFIFPGSQSPRKRDIEISGWSRKSQNAQTSAIRKAKLQLAARHVGTYAAKKLCTVPSTMGHAKTARYDAFMMHGDWKNAVYKSHG